MSSEGDPNLPLAIALMGGALLTGYMAFRPWPAPTGKPIKPGAYMFEILEGQAPAAGPPALSPTEVQATEYALGTFEAIWAVYKLGGVMLDFAQTLYDAVMGGISIFSSLAGIAGAAIGAAAGAGAAGAAGSAADAAAADTAGGAAADAAAADAAAAAAGAGAP